MIVTRFAPSPSGRLHLGHAYSAVIGRARGERFIVRIEDLDPGRCRPEFVDGIFEDLDWLGIGVDGAAAGAVRADEALRRGARAAEGGGPGLSLFLHAGRHRRLADRAARRCRKRLSRHLPRPPDDPERRATTPHSWRLDSAGARRAPGCRRGPRRMERTFRAAEADIGDAILARKDAPASYHLACVVDDAASGVTLVVRGEDLRPSTPVQRMLQMLIGLPEPTYLHHPLVAHSDGRRLAKRDLAPTLAAMRDAGVDGAGAGGGCSTRAPAPRIRLVERLDRRLMNTSSSSSSWSPWARPLTSSYAGSLPWHRARTCLANNNRITCRSACCSRASRSSWS